MTKEKAAVELLRAYRAWLDASNDTTPEGLTLLFRDGANGLSLCTVFCQPGSLAAMLLVEVRAQKGTDVDMEKPRGAP